MFSPSLEIIKWILIAQFAFIGLHIAIIFIIHPCMIFFLNQRNRKLLLLTKILKESIEQKNDWQELHLPKSLCSIELLTLAIQAIDRITHDAHWNSLKDSIFDHILFPKAQQLSKSKSWFKRMQSIGCFLQFPSSKIESCVLILLNDPIPLIQYSAAYCAAKIGSVSCVNAIIDKMNQVDRFLRHPFREALLKGSDQSFIFLEQRMRDDKNPHTHVSCLEVLSQHMNSRIAALAIEDISSPAKNLRIASVRALGYYPSSISVSILMDQLKNEEWEMRSIAARSLGYLKAIEALTALSLLLKDKVR